MKLSNWLSVERGRGLRLALDLGVSPVLISQWASGRRTPPFERCVPIERATDGEVRRCDLRPDDYLDMWPELAAPAVEPLPTLADEPLTTDPALNVALVGAEQAGLVKLPHPAPVWDGAERRVSPVPRRAADRLDIAAGQGV